MEIIFCISTFIVEMIHFSVNVQLITGDLPAQAKCNKLVNRNGFYACSRCLFGGVRCSKPCNKHILYKWVDFIRTPQPQRTQEHMISCAQQINHVNKSVFGVLGISPLSSIVSIPHQSTFDYFHLVLEIHFRWVTNRLSVLTITYLFSSWDIYYQYGIVLLSKMKEHYFLLMVVSMELTILTHLSVILKILQSIMYGQHPN